MHNHEPFTIRSVRLFDGYRIHSTTSVVVDNGLIKAVGAADTFRPEGEVLDGEGLTLLPGLIDAHVHAWGPLAKVLQRALLFGVTTELEMQCDGDGLTEARALKDEDPPNLAQLRSSGFPVTVAGGHGTEYGFAVPTIEDPDEAQDFIDARIAEGSDYIKIMYGEERRGLAVVGKELIRACVLAAHQRGRKVTAHIESLRTARDVIEAGADSISHIFGDDTDAEVGRFASHHGVAVCPTFSVGSLRGSGTSTGEALLADERVAPYLTSFDRGNLARTRESLNQELGRRSPPVEGRMEGYARAVANFRSLLDAGVPILAGTDAPNPGTTHGASLHRELELLVEAGMTPAQSLSAATSVPARCFDLDDRGRIARGLRADLLLVRGDPTQDITATRDIVGVWKAGARLERQARHSEV